MNRVYKVRIIKDNIALLKKELRNPAQIKGTHGIPKKESGHTADLPSQGMPRTQSIRGMVETGKT